MHGGRKSSLVISDQPWLSLYAAVFCRFRNIIVIRVVGKTRIFIATRLAKLGGVSTPLYSPHPSSSIIMFWLNSTDILLGLSQEGTVPEITEKITSTEVKEGDEGRYKGRYKDDHLLEESDTVIFENREDSHALIIKNVSLADEAEYKALARNPLGTVSCSTELLVEEPQLIEPMMDVQVCVPLPLLSRRPCLYVFLFVYWKYSGRIAVTITLCHSVTFKVIKLQFKSVF